MPNAIGFEFQAEFASRAQKACCSLFTAIPMCLLNAQEAFRISGSIVSNMWG